jgi:hypothetical protein
MLSQVVEIALNNDGNLKQADLTVLMLHGKKGHIFAVSSGIYGPVLAALCDAVHL